MNYFTELTLKDTIKDIVDILIVSYIFYKLIVMVRGTRAVQLLRGIFLLLISWALSTWLNLYTLKWVMNQIFTFGIVTVLIIFQPELRRALEKLGRGNFFNRVSSEDQDINHDVLEVTKSVSYLANRKIGALIVFERATGLNEFIESGIKMKAVLSSELLSNVFVPNTPLHDGAVIIRDNQMLAAACYLPLSENPFISKELGTRHRAAIGITEVGDALAVIVSEETGQISFAMNGNILRDVKEETLRIKLSEQLGPKFKQKNKTNWDFWHRKEGEDHG